MEEKQGSGTSQPVIILDQTALTHIQDKARDLFRLDPGGGNVAQRVMFQALERYLLERGVVPNFEVRL